MKKIIPVLFLLVSTLIASAQDDIDLTRINAAGVSFDDPVNLQNAGDERLFVVEQDGVIKIMQPDGTVNTEPFLDITGRVNGGGERGLLGLAFHPDYTTNGFFYLYYIKAGGDTQVSRFSVTADADIADPTSELPILDFAQPFSNHNGGCIAFGPDGMLFIGSGDGGSGGDPGNRAQNTSLLLGKILRIDIDNPTNGNEYGIPTDNPFAGSTTEAQEIWAYGIRNPWKFSFDSQTDDLWIADVGQGEIEEINKAASDAAGLNYGWRCYEGNEPFNTTGCPNQSELTFPVAFYNHPTGFSITGGNVYRGGTYQDLQGLYFFADFVTGLIGSVDETDFLRNYGTFGGSWSSFGVDMNNELYIVEYGEGNIFRIDGVILSAPEFTKNSISLLPNPASSEIRISSEVQINSVEIIDLKGSVILSQQMQATEKTIQISDVANGLYLVRLTSENGTAITKKLVVN